MLNLPNFLTLIRIVAIPFFLVLLASHLYLDALIVFVLGGVTDALDGFVARRMNQKTSLGAYLDPVADKLLLTSSFIMLGMMGGIPLWLVVLVVSRDTVILIGYVAISFLVDERMEVQPTLMGKLSTVFQLITIGVVLLMLANAQLLEPWLDDVLIYITAVTTVISGVEYLYRGLLWLQNRVAS
ncbi:MAG TPA: CDP-diacylglycerol--glycerol-3-phosphate 3-phosphatidyltransferase [Candidatus Binatia bacterium]|jgi:cardiolipin synthase